VGLDPASVVAVDGARRRAGTVLPLADGYTFAALPATVERLLAGGDGGLPRAALGAAPEHVERVALVLLDAFGWRFFARHADRHPLLRRMLADGAVAKLTTQFPSTTAAHVTTLHTGRPVREHGMYEWNIYEPSLDALVTPLLFSFAGDGERDTLRRERVHPRTLYPPDTLYQRLAARDVRCLAFHPATFAPSTYDGVLLDGATLHPYETLAGGLAALAAALAAAPAPAYAYLYIDTLDAIGHHRGPSSEAFDEEAVRCLDAVDAALGALPSGTLLLLAADHGQVDVDPARTQFVNELWPRIGSRLRRDARGRPLAPAGSARDLFLHSAPGAQEQLIERLRGLLGAHAEVHATADLVAAGLFGGAPGARLRERVGDVCVLPAAGETVWWRERGRFDMRFRGHHGGLTPDEAHTQVGSLIVG
jgi:Type I phosphodiesterase / nucleotide pyrophosphatase